MPSLKRVARGEKFIMYAYIPFKEVDEVKKLLKKAGFKKVTDEDMDNSDHEIGVEVTCKNASEAYEIISSVISY